MGEAGGAGLVALACVRASLFNSAERPCVAVSVCHPQLLCARHREAVTYISRTLTMSRASRSCCVA